MKKYIFFLSVAMLFIGEQNLSAQDTTTTSIYPAKTFHIAVFAPMYLDSAFNNADFNASKSIPKFIMPAVDFIQGARIAFDTLALNGKTAQVAIYDSKSNTQPISWLIKFNKLDNVDLIIGAVKEPDYRELADFALQKKIPFISAIYPNAGSVHENPFLFIVNATLKAHCEGIFSYILQKHGTDKVYLIKKKGDDRIENYFREINIKEGKPLLNIKTIVVDSTISPYSLRYRIDTMHTAVIIGASLDEDLARSLADACYPLQKNHPLILIGMPNWDGFKSLYKKDAYTGFPIRFTTPHYEEQGNLFDSVLIKKYFQLYRAKPSDMAYKGFGIAWYFTNLLLKYPNDFVSHINDTAFAAFHTYNFRPVYSIPQQQVPDYYENKHLFIMEILNGDIVREW